MSRSSRDSATTGLGNSGYQSAGARLLVRISGFPGSFGDQLVQVVGLGGGELAHGEVVQDEDGGAGELAEPFVPGEVGVAAGQVGQDPAGLDEPGLGAGADGQVAEGLGDMGLADPDRAVEDDRFPGVQPAQRGQVADLRGGQLRGGGEVEAFQGGLFSNRARRIRWPATWSARREISSSHRTCRKSRWPSSPAAAWARRASRVASMPDSFRSRSAAASAVRSVTVTAVMGLSSRRWR